MIFNTIRDGLNPYRGELVAVQDKSATGQRIEVINTQRFGKMMFINGVPQTGGDYDAYITEGMYSVAYHAHGFPQNVLILGGGDCMGALELLRHDVVSVTLVDWDSDVVEMSYNHLMTYEQRKAMDDVRLNLSIKDIREFIATDASKYDLIFLSLTDPVGKTGDFFGWRFFDELKSRLNFGGFVASHCESPEVISSPTNPEAFYDIMASIQKVFSPYSYPYRVWTPPYFEMFARHVSGNQPIKSEPAIAPRKYKWLSETIYNSIFNYWSADILRELAKRDQPQQTHVIGGHRYA